MLIEVDLTQAEWVVTAYAAKDARMIQVHETRADPHIRTGHLISGAPEELIQQEAKLLGHETDPDQIVRLRRRHFPADVLKTYFFPRIMTIRQAGKKSNHALNYNMGYKRFALENEMPEADAKRIVEAYHAAYRGLRGFYYPFVEAQLRTNRMLETCFGEVRTFYRDLSDHGVLEAAYAFIPQSTIGRLTNRGLRRIYDGVPQCEILANQHDGILTQTVKKTDTAAQLWHTLHAIDAAMTEPLTYHGQTFTIRREYKIGPDWGHMTEVPSLELDAVEHAFKQAQAV